MSTKNQSSRLAAMRAAADAAAEQGPDMNEATKGGERRLIPAGYAFARLVEYIDFGLQPQEFGGKVMDPAQEFQVGFALWGEGYQDPETGEPYLLRPFSMKLSRNEKSKSYKLFKALNYKGTAKAFPQLLGEAYLVKIEHVKGKDDTVRARLDMQGILPPVDPVSRKPYNIPEAPDELYRMFLWENPTIEAWDDLFIDGTWDDGRSKNFIQERIMSALDYEGSALQEVLEGGAALLPEDADEEDQAEDDPQVLTQAPAQVLKTPKVTEVPKVTTPAPAQAVRRTPGSGKGGPRAAKKPAARPEALTPPEA